MGKEKELTKTFFDEKVGKYRQFVSRKEVKIANKKIKEIIDEEIGQKKVIDLGSAGELHCQIEKASFFVSYDISYQLLREVRNDNFVHGVCGDVADLPFRNRTFDIAICVCLFHHLVGVNSRESHNLLSKVLSGIFEILTPGGKIIIVENCLPRILEKIENLSFSLFKRGLELIRKPPVRFLSILSIKNILAKTGFRNIYVVEIERKKTWQLIPLGVILPLKIPHKFIPTSLQVIIGKKQ